MCVFCDRLREAMGTEVITSAGYNKLSNEEINKRINTRLEELAEEIVEKFCDKYNM